MATQAELQLQYVEQWYTRNPSAKRTEAQTTKLKTQYNAKQGESTSASFALKYPSFAGMFDNGVGEKKAQDEFGGIAVGGNPLTDLFELMRDIEKFPKKYDLQSAEGIKAFDGLVMQTGYYIRTLETQRAFDFQAPVQQAETLRLKKEEIANDFGDLELDDAQLTLVAKFAARNGYAKGSLSLKHYAFKQVGAKTPKAVTEGKDAAGIKRIGAQWGYAPSEEQITRILTGAPDAEGIIPTAESFAKQAKASALGLYPHLKMQFDNGSTLEDVFSSYRQYAAKMLEISPDEIDFTDPKYQAAMGNTENGQMSLSDWSTLIRTNDKYNYRYTKRANRDATSMALSIARAFGKVE